MTLNQAKLILNSDGDLSIDQISEALEVIRNKEKVKKISTPEKSQAAYSAWKLRQKEDKEFRAEIRKYLPKSA